MTINHPKMTLDVVSNIPQTINNVQYNTGVRLPGSYNSFRSSNFEVNRIEFPGHNTPASQDGDSSYSSGYSGPDRACPTGRQTAEPQTPSNASRRFSFQLTHPDLQSTQYWV